MSNNNDDKNSQGGHFEKMTRQPRPPDAGSSEDIPFEKWDWQKHDPEFFTVFSRYPDAQDPDKLNAVKWNRYMLAKKGGMPKKPDYSPKNLAWVMRREIGVFCFSIFMGLFVVPWWYNGMVRASRGNQTQGMTPNGQ